jgi:Glycosyltransferase family 87
MRYFIFVLLIAIALILNTLGKKIFRTRWNLWWGYGIPSLAISLFLLSIPAPYRILGDFNKAYFPAGLQILQDPSALYDATCRTFVNLPILALLFTPFATTDDLLIAQYSFIVISTVGVFLAYLWLVKFVQLKDWQPVALMGLFAINGPLHYSLRLGNSTHFVFLFVIALFSFAQSRKEIAAGISLAAAVLLKPFLLPLGFYFVLRQRWRVAIAFMITLLSTVVASTLLFGLPLQLTWYNRCIKAFSGKIMPAFNVQSVDGFLARLLTEGNLTNFIPIDIPLELRLLRYAMVALLIGITFWICWRAKSPTSPQQENLELSIVLCLTLVISPISWTHYYLLLLIPFALFLRHQLSVPKGGIWLSLVAASIALTSPPVILIEPNNPFAKLLLERLFISHYFFGGVLLLGTLLVARLLASRMLPSFEKTEPIGGVLD